MKRTALYTALAAASMSLLIPFAGVAGEKPDARSNQLPLRFKDANGKVLGRVAWGNRYGVPFVVMQEAKQVFAVNVNPPGSDRTRFDFSGGGVYYETTDCSGQAYLQTEGDFILPGLRTATVMLPGDGRTLIFVGSGTPSLVHALSFQYRDFSCETDRNDIGGAPVTDTIDITGKYQAPFSIR